MNIVIVDDDIVVSGALKTILEASGDITVSATGTDGKDAVRLFRTYRPDVTSYGHQNERTQRT